MNQQIYLDYAASTPCDPRVLEQMLPYFTVNYGNSVNTTHEFGKKALQAVEMARGQVANFLHCLPQQIIWTSGATESNNLAIQGAVASHKKRFPGRKLHIVTSAIEHKAVLETCEKLQSDKIEVSFVKPDLDGIISTESIANHLKETTFLVSIMLANNELGIVNSLTAISDLCQRSNILLHTDATQYVGKLPLSLQTLKVDLLSMSSHKIYGPKGVGALYVRNLSVLEPIVFGGGHENGYRSGTLNVPGIVGLGKACQLCQQEQDSDFERINSLRNQLEISLKRHNPSIIINGVNTERLPNISNITFPVKEGYSILQKIKLIACSSGAACDTPDNRPSHVMIQIGRSSHQAKNSLRISLGRFTKEEDITHAIKHLIDVLAKIGY